MTPQTCSTCRWWSELPNCPEFGNCHAPIPVCSDELDREYMRADRGENFPVWSPHDEAPHPRCDKAKTVSGLVKALLAYPGSAEVFCGAHMEPVSSISNLLCSGEHKMMIWINFDESRVEFGSSAMLGGLDLPEEI